MTDDNLPFRRRDASVRRALLLSLALAGVGPAMAQVTTGNMNGYVRDASGASVPGANVSAKMIEQQAVRTTQTNQEGYYTLLALPPGDYEVTFEAPGFQRQVQTGIELSINQNLRLDATLAVGAVETQVTVEATAPLVDTTSPTLSGLVDDRRVVDLPLNGRNVIGLARILPGVLGVSAPQQLSDARSGPKMNVNGGRPNMNLFTFNGGYFNNPSRNTGMNYPPPDAVQEFRIQTHNFAAEYGRNPGSQINVVSKSGTNEFHGSAWEFLRNDALNARNFFASRVPAIKQNQFGAAGGGPVLKDRVFFFGTYQGLRDRREAQTVEALVPSSAERRGDFSGLDTTLQNPTDPVTGAPFTDSAGRPCVQNNVILPGCISPVAQKLLAFVPESPTGLVSSLASSPRDGDMFMVRGDYNQSSAHRIYGSYFYDRNKRFNPFAGGNIPNYMEENFIQSTHHLTLSDTYTFTPTLLNQATFTFLNTPSDQVQSRTVDPTELGINMPQYVPTGSVQVDVDNFSLGSGFTTRFYSRNWQFRDTLSWIKGRHNFKFGYELLRLQFRQVFIGSPGFTFNGSRSGHPVSDFMLGAFDNLNLNFGVRDTDSRTWAHAAFVQDEFKVNRRFTLTLGVRYEPFLPWVEKDDRINTVAPGVQSTVVPDAPIGVLFPGDVPRGLANNDLNNWAGRIGLAWDVTGTGRTSVRAGYGIFYESVNGDSLAQENPPFAGFSSVFSGRIENPYGSVGRTPPPAQTTGQFGCAKIAEYPGYDCPLFPLPVGGVFTERNLRTPYIQSFNLAIQHQLTPTLMVETAYAGKIGIKLEALRTYNPARFINSPVDGSPPSDQNINDRVIFEPGILSPVGFLLGNDFRSWYHSFQTQVTKRFSQGITVLASYTLSKSIDTSSTDNLGATVANPFNLRDERGRSDWDRRHAFVASWLWSPQPNLANPVGRALLRDWTITGIHTIQSGRPLTFLMGDDVALDGTFGDQHAQLKPNVTVSDIEISHSSRAAMITRFFNTDAFVPTNDVPRGIYGNAGRGLISGPALNSTDFSVLRDFVIREPMRLQFRSEFFNAFNQVNFANPTTAVNSGNFGRIRSAGDPRIIQFGLKFLW
ncbi:MAG: TonB-dependent receptor [Bryobacteraceae bacterium]|nr:TonB-dependent receptor [Bryobacteraceae bacterium]